MSACKSLIDDIKEKTEAINKTKKELVEKLRPDFKELFTPFLEKYPQVTHLKWNQYTPYFNDGESCTFSVNDLFGFLGTEEEDDYEGSLPDYYVEQVAEYRTTGINSAWSEWTKTRVVEKNAEYPEDISVSLQMDKDFDALVKAFDQIPDDIMLELFGDHTEITVTREGLDVEEYSHD